MKYRAARKSLKVTFNAPVILGFTITALLVMILNLVSGGRTNSLLFSVYRSSPANPFTYIRLFLHVLGHTDWSHYFGNIMLLLVVGPLLEEKYGSMRILTVIAVTAVITGLVQILLFPGHALLGASGIVFAMILLSSLTSMQEGEIPLTFILVAALYLGQQLYEGFVIKDNVSQLTHIIGGVVGSAFGFALQKRR